MSLAQFIDHTALKQTTHLTDIEQLCGEATGHGFAAVCVPPFYVSFANDILIDSAVRIATVIGFPFGYHSIASKVAEAEEAIRNGADELDLVMNVAAFKSNMLSFLEEEISELVAVTKKNDILIKVIIESGILSEEEIIRCCRLYKNYDVDFLKTSTGFAEKGASEEAVRLMRAHLPGHIRIKASGGIRTAEEAQRMIDAGASRLGCSASVAIVTGEKGSGTY
jgi:deoxyribose-phosphate aldolase